MKKNETVFGMFKHMISLNDNIKRTKINNILFF